MSERLRQFEREQAREWVEARRGHWDHAGWLSLLDGLRRDGWRDLDADAVGAVLERKKDQYHRLRRWDDRGEAWDWVVSHNGEWRHHEWMTLLAGVQCWLGPVDAGALGDLLAGHRRTYHEWRRWIATGTAARWVEAREGHWGHDEWLAFVGTVRAVGFGDLPADLIGVTLEECKRAYWRRRHWEESGEAYRWVEARRGEWTHDDWLRLLASLERSVFWPLDVAAVGRIVEGARRRYLNLREWQRSGAALLWVTQRDGEWAPSEWLQLLAQFQGREQDEVEPQALSEALDDLREQYDNLRRWLERRAETQERVLRIETPARRAA